MKTAIFIKSFPGDYGWLHYCLRSIQRFVTGQSEIVVVLPETDPLPLTNERVVLVKEWNSTRGISGHEPQGSSYYHQMFVKMCADLHCPDSDCVLFVDSDCVFKRPFDVSEMFTNGKPVLLCRLWQDAAGGIKWREPAEAALGFKTVCDTMATHPSIYLNSTIKATRKHIEAIHRMPFEDYVRSREMFIEFVTLGNYALAKEPQLYERIHCDPVRDKYPRPLHQFHSPSGISPAIRIRIEGILK